MADKQLAFYVNMNKCTGCKACQVSCKTVNELPLGVKWRRIVEVDGGEWLEDGDQQVPSNVFAYFVSAACMHCENPLCVQVCPTGAMSKRDEDGVVIIDQDKCIGCRYCEWACPYSAPQFDAERGVMTKCHFCYELLDKGEKPACVDGCTFRALDFGTVEELREKYGDFDAPAPLPDSSITKPSIVYTPTPNTLTHDSPAANVMNTEEL